MQKREAKFQTIFAQIAKDHLPHVINKALFELKQTDKDYISFDAVKTHQVHWGLAAKHRVVLYKISDESSGYKPCDCFLIRGGQSFVVIKFPGDFYIIDMDVFVHEKNTSSRKSLTESRAKEIAAYSGHSLQVNV